MTARLTGLQLIQAKMHQEFEKLLRPIGKAAAALVMETQRVEHYTEEEIEALWDEVKAKF